MAAPETIHVEGLRELRDALRLIEPKLQGKLRTRFKRIATKVADEARSNMPRRTGKAQAAVRGGASTTTAYVVTGKASTPYTPWLDFGGTLRPSGGRLNTQIRPRVKGGRYLYPAIKRMRPQTERAALDAMNETARDLGL